MSLKYITGHQRPPALDVARTLLGCIISYIRSIKFSSTTATAILPRYVPINTYFSIGRLRISSRVNIGKLRGYSTRAQEDPMPAFVPQLFALPRASAFVQHHSAPRRRAQC
jgi:hypothetical protein